MDLSDLSRKFEATHEKVLVPEDVSILSRGGIALLSSRKVAFSHNLANQVIGAKEMPGDRPMRPAHVNYLINAMMRNTFRFELVNLILCQHDGDQWRMNGQHTCLARLELPERWDGQGQVTLSIYDAQSFDDMRELYSSIDRGAPRTRRNIIDSYLVGTSQFDGMPRTIINGLAEGLAFWLWESQTERSKHDADEIAHLLTSDYRTLVDSVSAFCMSEPKISGIDWLRRAPVIAAMYETFSKVVQPSVTFWHAVRTGVGFASAHDPALKLRDKLMGVRIASGDSLTRSETASREDIYRWCIAAFNAWRAGGQLRQLKTTQSRYRAK